MIRSYPLRTLLLGLGLGLVLSLTLWLYARPETAILLAEQLWACF